MTFNFEVKKFNISGEIKLNKKRLVLIGEIPLLARLFEGQIRDTIKSNLEELF